MKLKELMEVLYPDTLLKVKVNDPDLRMEMFMHNTTIPHIELNKYLDNEVELIAWTAHNGICVLVSEEKRSV